MEAKNSEINVKDSELDFCINLLYTNNQALKKMEENQKRLKNIIIAKLDVLKTKKYSASDFNYENAENKSKPLSVILVENTKMNFDLDKVRKIAPDAIDKTLTVNKENITEFKNLLKEFGLTGKQVNELVKVMNIKISVDEEKISKKFDKGEIDSKQLSEVSQLNVTSRYIKFV